MKKYIYRLSLILFYFISTSYSLKPKPHLIEGNWALIGNQKSNTLFLKDGKAYSINILAFSSDQITSSFSLIGKEKKDDQQLTFAFRIFEPFDDFKSPIVLFKNLCDNKSRIAFSVLQLDKAFLKLKFEKKYSSDNISIMDSVLNFERTAGPPENMP